MKEFFRKANYEIFSCEKILNKNLPENTKLAQISYFTDPYHRAHKYNKNVQNI